MSASEMALTLHNGLWYVSVREHGRARVYQLETRPPRVTWKDHPDGATPVIEVGQCAPDRRRK
ncbi:MAG: hypothetical protein M3422_17530 [Actinomycetota bacterium]|nr:hypothetical protein [Actinomycetota bacterium]